MKIKNRIYLVSFLMVAGLLGSTSSFAAKGENAGQKIGVVNVQQAIEKTKEGRKAKSEYEKYAKAQEKKLKDMEKDLKKQREDIEKKADILSKELREQKILAFQQELGKFEKTARETSIEVRKKEQELLQPILKQMREVIDDVAKNEKYDLILDSAQGVLFASKNFDLTDKVIKAFEKKKKK